MRRMKNVFVLVMMLIATAALCVVSYIGIGDNVRLGVANINLGLDLAGGVSIVYQAEEGSNPSSEEMDGALAVIQRRLDAKGYTEANAYLDGTDRIRVEIPGVKDASEAVEEIGKTAMLTFVGVDWDTMMLDEELLAPYYEQYVSEVSASITAEELEALGEDSLYEEAESFFTVYPSSAAMEYPEVLTDAIEAGYAEVVLTGTEVENATYQYGQFSDTGAAGPYVKLTLTGEGRNIFADATEAYAGQFIAIRLDETVCSMPSVTERITAGEAIISGIETEEEAKMLAADIVGGALPVQLEDIQHNSVGATLGQDSLETSIIAAAIGFILIIIFMIIYYKIPGIAAALSLGLYIALELLMINVLDLTLTLSGIAGIILSVGMAVDANVIIFARITEELREGRGLRVSVYTGFKKALSAILDGNITTLLVAGVLWFLGSGSIRGFAQTLALGIVISMVTALFVTRLYVTQFIEIISDEPKKYMSLDFFKKHRNAVKEGKA